MRNRINPTDFVRVAIEGCSFLVIFIILPKHSISESALLNVKNERQGTCAGDNNVPKAIWA
jgi:uncharacterized OsmC-like protein